MQNSSVEKSTKSIAENGISENHELYKSMSERQASEQSTSKIANTIIESPFANGNQRSSDIANAAEEFATQTARNPRDQYRRE